MTSGSHQLSPGSARLLLASVLVGLTMVNSRGATTEAQSVVIGFGLPTVASAGTYATVKIPGCQLSQRPGEPRLPFRTLRLLVPTGSRVEQISARPLGEPVVLETGQWVEHGRLPVATAVAPNQPTAATPSVAPEPDIYHSDAPYPAARVELLSIQHLAGNAVALARVYPIQYLPEQGILVFTPQLLLEWTVRAEPATASSVVVPRRGDRFRAHLEVVVDNPEFLANVTPAIPNGQGGGGLVDYLVVTRSNLVAAFQPLVDRKVQQGLVVEVATVETITDTTAGRDVPEKIRNYIRTVYTTSSLSYVLIGGDTQVVPCRYAYANMGGLVPLNTTIPCDLYYACLDGSWNGNGNNLWGEATDGEDGGDVDLLAEVAVGRAPVDTPAEATAFVAKTLRYESQPHPQTTNALFMAEFLQDFPSGPAQGADMFEPLQPFFQGYTVTWLDDSPFTTPQWNRADALQSLNTSPHLALYNGHGDVDTMMRMSTSDLDFLVNQWPFLVYSVGCNAGEFDNDKFSPDSIGEELVKRDVTGAFAAILNSREGWYDPTNEWQYSGEFQTQFFDHLLNRLETNLGVANQLAKHDLVGLVETTGPIMTYRWCYYEITLFGDPHLTWQQASPSLDTQDSDGDGSNNWEEAIAGTDPQDPASVLRIAATLPTVQGAPLTLEWPSVEGRTYSVLGADLPHGTFVVLADNLAATPPANRWSPPSSSGSTGFYRIVARRLP